MRTTIKKQGDTVVVNVEGKLDFETTTPLRQDLEKIVRPRATDSVPKKIIFNLEKLEFVGSSGISGFVQTLREFNRLSPTRPRYCHVRSEFKRIIEAFDQEQSFDIFDTEDSARKKVDQ